MNFVFVCGSLTTTSKRLLNIDKVSEVFLVEKEYSNGNILRSVKLQMPRVDRYSEGDSCLFETDLTNMAQVFLCLRFPKEFSGIEFSVDRFNAIVKHLMEQGGVNREEVEREFGVKWDEKEEAYIGAEAS